MRRRNRAARVRDAFRETRECFLPRADGGRAGNRDRQPPSKERDKSVLTVREGNYTARASFQYNTGRFGLERLACPEFPAEARFTSPNQNCYNTEARKFRQHRALQRVLHELLAGGYSYFRHWEKVEERNLETGIWTWQTQHAKKEEGGAAGCAASRALRCMWARPWRR